jgi:hypothetical protein
MAAGPAFGVQNVGDARDVLIVADSSESHQLSNGYLAVN